MPEQPSTNEAAPQNAAPQNAAPQNAGDEERLEEIIQRLGLDDESTDKVRTLLRLAVGGALIGWDELFNRLEQWEAGVQDPHSQGEPGARTVVFVEPGSRVTPERTPASRTVAKNQELRYLLLGLLFETESRIHERSSALIDFAGQTTSSVLSPLVRWMDRSERLQPARSRFDRLVQRGEEVTDRWIQRGRLEESHSRRLVVTASQDTFDSSMELLGQAPELQNLVKMQSAGLSREVLDEVRSRTVSGDLVAEGFVRRLLRRAPRGDLPDSTVTSEESQSTAGPH